jgi:hypothetical protein
VLQRLNIVVGQELGEPIAPLHRQNRRQGIELERASGCGVGALMSFMTGTL